MGVFAFFKEIVRDGPTVAKCIQSQSELVNVCDSAFHELTVEIIKEA